MPGPATSTVRDRWSLDRADDAETAPGGAMGQDRDSTDGVGRKVTFLGRGLGLRSQSRLTLLVCPLCSQRNGDRMAAKGTCAYEPAERDEEPCGPDH